MSTVFLCEKHFTASSKDASARSAKASLSRMIEGEVDRLTWFMLKRRANSNTCYEVLSWNEEQTEEDLSTHELLISHDYGTSYQDSCRDWFPCCLDLSSLFELTPVDKDEKGEFKI